MPGFLIVAAMTSGSWLSFRALMEQIAVGTPRLQRRFHRRGGDSLIKEADGFPTTSFSRNSPLIIANRTGST
jgi:hypothetical protein